MPTTYFISRHPGAIDWAGRHGLSVQHVDHLDTDTIGAGDTVIGTLPVHLAAAVCERGARYVHLRLDLPRGHRGQELSATTWTGSARGSKVMSLARQVLKSEGERNHGLVGRCTGEHAGCR